MECYQVDSYLGHTFAMSTWDRQGSGTEMCNSQEKLSEKVHIVIFIKTWAEFLMDTEVTLLDPDIWIQIWIQVFDSQMITVRLSTLIALRNSGGTEVFSNQKMTRPYQSP